MDRLKEYLGYINPIPKKLLLLGIIISEVLLTVGLCALIIAGHGADYWFCIHLAEDAINAVRPSMGVTLLGAVLTQAAEG